ncbi:MAG: virulence RhuM family protein [Coprothermobacterota bacterium]|nr:virulence RhuM family protein [Coprothermobacterota bacterium]
MKNNDRGEIVIYKHGESGGHLEVRLEQESLWLSLNQIAAVFERDKSVISRHLSNVFREGELDREAVVAFFATTAADGKTYKVEYFNLDAILSVGYRVNSIRGTQFRIWATQVLRDHLIKGYSANSKRLEELQQSLKLVGKVLERYDVTSDQARAILRVVTDYASALDLLDDYDHQRVSVAHLEAKEARGIDYDEAMTVIGELRRKFGGSDLFGREKDQSLRGSLGAVMQSFDGKDLYPSLEEKAAHLLYFLVKDHSFVDGNKRIAAALFLWFMEKNGILYRADGFRHIADNALVAITLMIAESNPNQKDILTKVVVNLIQDGPQRMAGT